MGLNELSLEVVKERGNILQDIGWGSEDLIGNRLEVQSGNQYATTTALDDPNQRQSEGLNGTNNM